MDGEKGKKKKYVNNIDASFLLGFIFPVAILEGNSHFKLLGTVGMLYKMTDSILSVF